jgi:hypothetical protein
VSMCYRYITRSVLSKRSACWTASAAGAWRSG